MKNTGKYLLNNKFALGTLYFHRSHSDHPMKMS